MASNADMGTSQTKQDFLIIQLNNYWGKTTTNKSLRTFLTIYDEWKLLERLIWKHTYWIHWEK